MTNTQFVVRSLLAVGIISCSSSTVTMFSGPIVLTGSYVGFQEGTDGTLSFQDDPFELTLFQNGDSVSGTWITTIGGLGTMVGAILPSDSILEFTMEMTQETPCEGTFTGTAEARLGIQGNGQSTIGIIGSYAGDDCDSATDAAFFVQRVN